MSDYMQTQGFVFGTMAMKPFYVALNTTAGRVGLAQVTGKVDVGEGVLYRASKRRTAS